MLSMEENHISGLSYLQNKLAIGSVPNINLLLLQHKCSETNWEHSESSICEIICHTEYHQASLQFF